MRSCKLFRFRAWLSFNMCLAFGPGNSGLRIFRTADVGRVCVVSRNRHFLGLRATQLKFVLFTAFSSTIICGNIPKKTIRHLRNYHEHAVMLTSAAMFSRENRGKLFSCTPYVRTKCYAVLKCTPATSRRNRSNLSPRRGHLIS